MSGDLLSYLQRRADGYLRAVATYDEETCDIVYLRDDLDEAAIDQKVTTIHAGIQAGLGISDIEEEVGERYATLQLRGEAVLLNLTRGETEGTLVSLEPEAARQLTGFLNECMKHSYHDSVDF